MMLGFALGLAAAARVPASPLLSLSSKMFQGPTCSQGVPVAGGAAGAGIGVKGAGGAGGGPVHVKLGSGGRAGGPTLMTAVMNWMKDGHVPDSAAHEPFGFAWQSTQNCGVPIKGQVSDHPQPQPP